MDDDRAQGQTLSRMLEMEGYEVHFAESGAAALEAARTFRPDAVVSDLRMPGMTGLELFEKLAASDPGLVFFVVTAFGTLDTAVAAMRAGVHDFITKPVDMDEMLVRLGKALWVRALQAENRQLKRAVEALAGSHDIVGSSPGMQRVLATIDQVARSHATVLVQGESGTGKELVARAIHRHSPRASGPYVRVNCAAVPDNLLEDELFGHAKGAFTGAVADRKGKFTVADGGTIFLDEVGDMPLHLQPKLLRVLQEREIEPVGTNRVTSVDVRVIAATHQDLRQMVAEGRFREDLFYRLNVIPMTLPPLRERGSDIEVLAQHFLARFREENNRKIAGFTGDALQRLRSYAWPGNVRELENCVERAVVLSYGEQIDAGDLLLEGPRKEGALGPLVDTLLGGPLSLSELEREIIVESLQRCDGNLSRTARHLGLTRRALQYRVEKIRAESADPDRHGGGDGD